MRRKKRDTKGKETKEMEKQEQLSRYYNEGSQLSYKLTQWSKSLPSESKRFIVCTGGGPGMMEAANRGASLARGISIGLNISLPFEQAPNPYITSSLSIDFHYFFMRKYWFVYLAKALVVLPGGFGTLDELFEVLTLVQTKKVTKPIPIVMYGSEYWKSIINFDALVDWGTINENDLDLMYFSDDVDDAYNYLVKELTESYLEPEEK